ncbi:hypothetical protein JW859_15330 [bacterium]|nr:hypothetical protein [bacterium]
MRIETVEDIHELLDGYATAAALGAALELGLFWRLGEQPRPAREIARELGIPFNRCQNWLQLLVKLGLLTHGDQGYAPSATARETILDVFSQDTWAFLALSNRQGAPALHDLAARITRPGSTWEHEAQKPPDYYRQIQTDPRYAERFTRMIYEIHVPLAEILADLLDLGGVKLMLDLGGGSGVISHALLRGNPGLTAVIVDNENVCTVGREIARENDLADRVSYLAADFVRDELPAGYDLAMLCDVGQQDPGVYAKVRAALNPGGRLVIVDKLSADEHTAVRSRVVWALLSSLDCPADICNFRTVDSVKAHLKQAGFRDITARAVPNLDQLRWNKDWTIIEASK